MRKKIIAFDITNLLNNTNWQDQIINLANSNIPNLLLPISRGLSDEEASYIWQKDSKFAASLGIRRIVNDTTAEIGYIGFGFQHAINKHEAEFAFFGGFAKCLEETTNKPGISLLSRNNMITLHQLQNDRYSVLITDSAGALISFYTTDEKSPETSVHRTFMSQAIDGYMQLFEAEDSNFYIKVFNQIGSTIYIKYQQSPLGDWKMQAKKILVKDSVPFERSMIKINDKAQLRKIMTSIATNISHTDLSELNNNEDVKQLQETLSDFDAIEQRTNRTIDELRSKIEELEESFSRNASSHNISDQKDSLAEDVLNLNLEFLKQEKIAILCATIRKGCKLPLRATEIIFKNRYRLLGTSSLRNSIDNETLFHIIKAPSISLDLFTTRINLFSRFSFEQMPVFLLNAKRFFGVDAYGKPIMSDREIFSFVATVKPEVIDALNESLTSINVISNIFSETSSISAPAQKFADMVFNILIGKKSNNGLVKNFNLNDKDTVLSRINEVVMSLQNQKALLNQLNQLLLMHAGIEVKDIETVCIDEIVDELAQALHEFLEGVDPDKGPVKSREVAIMIKEKIHSDDLYVIRSSGISFSCLRRNLSDLRTGKETGDCTAPGRENHELYLSDWLSDPRFQTIKVHVNRQMVVRFNLVVQEDEIFVDAVEASPKLSEGESENVSLSGNRDTYVLEGLKFIRSFFPEQKIYINRISNSPWVVDILEASSIETEDQREITSTIYNFNTFQTTSEITIFELQLQLEEKYRLSSLEAVIELIQIAINNNELETAETILKENKESIINALQLTKLETLFLFIQIFMDVADGDSEQNEKQSSLYGGIFDAIISRFREERSRDELSLNWGVLLELLGMFAFIEFRMETPEKFVIFADRVASQFNKEDIYSFFNLLLIYSTSCSVDEKIRTYQWLLGSEPLIRAALSSNYQVEEEGLRDFLSRMHEALQQAETDEINEVSALGVLFKHLVFSKDKSIKINDDLMPYFIDLSDYGLFELNDEGDSLVLPFLKDKTTGQPVLLSIVP